MANHYIRAWRKHRQMTQAEFAERMGLSGGHIHKIEAGRVSYTQDLLERAAVVLGCTPVDLLMRDPADPAPILVIYQSLGETQKAQLVAIAKTLKGGDDAS
jgi:transcriptional regulator with XRE-family HTH domain